MEDRTDAFGHLFIDYLAGGTAAAVVERDDGFIDASWGPEVYLARYGHWPEYHRRAMRYVRGRVLDIGCGAGRHSIYLQGKGYDVTGIDESPRVIEVCRKRGLKNAVVGTVTGVSAELGKFDTLLMLGNNFGLFGSLRRARWLLRRFRGLTQEGARIIAETLDPYDTTAQCHIEYHRRNRMRGRMPGQVRLRVRYRNYATPWFDYLFVSWEEMRALLDGTGWRVGRFIGSGGPQYIAVIERA